MKMHVPILTEVEKASQDGLRKGTRAVLARARVLSPTESGASDKTGFTRVDDLTGQVGFTSLVSMLQHENLDNVHENGEQAKFLETAAAEIDVAEFIALEVGKVLGG